METMILDVLIGLNLAVVIILLLAAFIINKEKSFTMLVKTIPVITAYSFLINIAITVFILVKGAVQNSFFIGFFSSILITSAQTQNIIIGSVIFLIILAVQIFVFSKWVSDFYIFFEVSERFIQNKNQYNPVFYNSLETAGKFIFYNEIIKITKLLVILTGGVLLETLLRGASLSNAFIIYAPLVTGAGLILIITSLLISLAAGIIVIRLSTPNSSAAQRKTTE